MHEKIRTRVRQWFARWIAAEERATQPQTNALSGQP
jgi:hypothetical protein